MAPFRKQDMKNQASQGSFLWPKNIFSAVYAVNLAAEVVTAGWPDQFVGQGKVEAPAQIVRLTQRPQWIARGHFRNQG